MKERTNEELKQIQEFNRRKIICAVHNTEDYEEALEKEWSINYKTTLATRNTYYGEPATLSKVLLALGNCHIEMKITTDNSPDKTPYLWIFNNQFNLLWDLKEETLEEQLPETQISIAKLLGYE